MVNEQLAATAPARPDLLSTLRHDLRTPVNHIIGYSELLIESAEDLGQAELIPSIHRIHNAGTALLSHIQAALDPSASSQSGTVNLDPLGYHLRTELNAIIGYSDMLQEESDEQGCREMAADFRRIYSAGKHLLGVVNAVLELAKSDVGEVDQAQSAAGRSSLGKETKLDRLPPVEDALAEPPAWSASLLVVDDNDINRDMLARRLQRLGHRIAVAENGLVALARLEAEPFDLVLLDILMPVMNGFQVLEHLRSSATLRRIPVIVVSAMDELESIVRCIQLGADDYLISPINPVLLKARIAASLERRRVEAQLLQQQRALAVMDGQRRVTAAEERLRREIAELLHGPVQTKLLVAWVRLGQCQDLLASDPAAARLLLEEVRGEIERVREQEVRQASHLLHPAIIRLGLAAAVRSLCQRFEEHFRIAIHIGPALAALDDPLENRIPEPLRLVAYRVIEEALNNIFRHAGASQTNIDLDLDGERRLSVVVADDGRGFDPALVRQGLGLASIAGRVEQVSGTWQLTSAAGQGTRLSVLLPFGCPDEAS